MTMRLVVDFFFQFRSPPKKTKLTSTMVATNFEATRCFALISNPPGQRFMVLASPVPNEREKRFFEQILLHGGPLTLEAPAASTNSPSKVFFISIEWAGRTLALFEYANERPIRQSG